VVRKRRAVEKVLRVWPNFVVQVDPELLEQLLETSLLPIPHFVGDRLDRIERNEAPVDHAPIDPSTHELAADVVDVVRFVEDSNRGVRNMHDNDIARKRVEKVGKRAHDDLGFLNKAPAEGVWTEPVRKTETLQIRKAVRARAGT
jgi:hypothetical protein